MNILSLALIGYLGFTVGPAKVEKTVLGAENVTEVFEVQNFTNDSLRIKVEFEDFDIDETGRVSFYAPGHFSNSLASRATVNPEECIVPPKGVENLRVTSVLPRDGAVPEYRAMILFKSKPIPTTYSTAVNVAGEIGVPIYYTISQYAVKGFSLDSFFVQNDTLEIVLSNTGNVHLRVKGEFVISTHDTKIVQQDSLPELVVMPGRRRKLNIGIKETIRDIVHVAKVIFDYGAIELIMGERKFAK